MTSTGSGAITLGSTVNGAQTLTVNTAGATTFTGTIGGTTPLTSVTTDQPGTVTVASATTTGAQTYNENTVTLNGTYTTTNSAFTAGTAAAAITLGGDTSVSTGTGAILLNGAVNGAQSLTANSTGTTTFNGAVGNLTPLTTLTTNAGGTTALNGGSVTTTGNQTYGDAVTMNQATTVTSTGGGSAVSFGGNVTNTLAGAPITVTTPALTLANGTTVATTGNGNISFFVDGLIPGTASINAGTGTFQISPSTPTKTIEYGDVNTARVTDVYYGSTFTNITAGSFTIGGATQTGDIFVTGVAAAPAPTTLQNGGTGGVTFENAPYVATNQDLGVVSGTGGITLGQNLTLGTGALRLTTTGAVSQPAGGITAALVGIAAGTGITMNQATNDVNTLAAQSTTGGIVFRDSDDVVLGAAPAVPGLHPALNGITATGQSVTLTTGGALTQTQPIVADSLTATTLNNAGAAITLTNPSNAVTTVTLQARDATNTADAAGAIAYRDTDGVDVAGVRTASTFDLTTNGALTDSGALVVAGTTTLAAGAANNITLNNANNFSTVSITSGNDVVLNDINALDLGASTVSGTLNVTTNGALTDSGALVVAGTTTLAAGAANNITLNNANNFSTVSITSGNDVVLNDINALDLGASTVSGTLNVTTNGALTDSGALVVAGTTTLAAGAANNITLNNANNFSTVSITSGNDVTLVDTNALTLGASTVSGDLTVTTGGLLNQSGALSVAGNAAFDTTAAAALGSVTFTDSNALTLNNSTVGGNLSVTTGAGDITLPAGQTLTVAGNVTLTPAGAVDLQGTTQIGGTQSYVGGTGSTFVLGADTNLNSLPLPGTGSVTVNTTGTTTTFGGAPIPAQAIDLTHAGNSIGGTVRFTTAAPAVTGSTQNTYNLTQSAPVTMNAGQTLTVTDLGGTAGKRGNVTLPNAANSFQDVNLLGGNLALTDSGALTIGATGLSANAGTTSTGTLALTSTGAITQLGPITAAGSTTLSAGAANNITLNNANNFSTVSITSGNDVVLNDINALDLGASTVSGTLNVTTNGALTDSGALVVAGTTTLAAGAANNITLNNANNFSTVSITSGNDVVLNDINALDLGASTVSGTLNVTTNGALTDSGALVVAGTTTLAAGAANNITLNNANNFSTVSITSGNDVVLNDINALDLGASTVSGTLNVTTNGALTDSGALVVAGTTTLAAGAANNITLNNANNFSTVSITSGNDVVLNDINALDLGASTVSGTLNVTTNGALTDSGALVVAGTTTLAAGAANNITLNNANNFSTVSITSGNDVVLNDINALDLGASTVSGTLNVTTNGALTDSGALVVAGTTTLAAGAANNITLNNANNFSTVSITSGNDVVLNDINALDLGASTVSSTFALTTGGALTHSGALCGAEPCHHHGAPSHVEECGQRFSTLAQSPAAMPSYSTMSMA